MIVTGAGTAGAGRHSALHTHAHPRASDVSMLLCRSGSAGARAARTVGVPIEVVVETMRPQPVDVLPGVEDYIGGVSLIRGEAVPVVDVATLLGGGPAPIGRFVTIRIGDRIAALAVESVLGIEILAAEAMPALPPLLGNVDDGVVSALGRLDGSLLLVLAQSRLVPPGIWNALEQRRPPSVPAQPGPSPDEVSSP